MAWSKSFSFSSTLAFFAVAAFGQTTDERVLVPITFVQQSVPGANGSLWTFTLVARNTSSSPVRVSPVVIDCGGISLCVPGPGTIWPRESVKLVPVSSSDRPAAVVYVESGHSSDLAFSLRVQDISRQSQTWGTDIPVVRENELRTRTITLLDVPVTAAFRNTIRIYDVDGRQGAEVRVRLFGLDPKQIGIGIPAQPDELLGEKVIALRPPLAAESATSPGYLEIGDLSLIAPLGEWRRVLIEIEPLIVGLRLWAFVSVTNNDTQHVTVITPQ